MSYGHLGQKKPGFPRSTPSNTKSQPGSRSNQTATNAAKAGAKVATSDQTPITTREVRAPEASRPQPSPLTERGYSNVKKLAGGFRKVGSKITRTRM